MRSKEIVMSKMKYIYSRPVKNGSLKWVVSPPAYVKAAVNAQYMVFTNQSDATEYSKDIQEAYESHKRGKNKKYLEVDTVESLIDQYKKSQEWKNLTANSKRTYNQLLGCMRGVRVGESRKTFQNMRISNIDVKYSGDLHQQLEEDVSTHRANHTCKVLRRIWSVGERRSGIKFNPFRNMGLKKPVDSRPKVLWQPEQVHLFIQTADQMGLPSMGTMALMCYDLCQRPGDMRQMTWDKYKNQRFGFEQEKNKSVVDIPASPRLLERLQSATVNTNHNHIVYYEKTGKTYDRRHYNKVFCRVRNQANLPSLLQMRDLRRTGATEMAEAGCTNTELRSVTGHKSVDVLAIYVRPTVKLATAGINKRFG